VATVNDRTLFPYWFRALQIGLNAVIVIVFVLGPLLFVSHKDIPVVPFLGLCAIAVLGVVVMRTRPWDRYFAAGTAMRWLYAWTALNIAVISTFIAIAGPTRPDYFVLYIFATVFFATVYPRRAQIFLFAFLATAYLLVWSVFGEGEPISRALYRVVALGIVAYMASFLSSELMQQMAAHSEAREDADKRASLIRTVAAAARDMSVLGPGAVLDAVVHAADKMGFEAVEICSLDESTGRYEVIRSRGLPSEYTSRRHDTARGVVGMVMRERQTVVVDDYSALSDAADALKAFGFKAVIGTRIEVHDRVAALLVAGTRAERHLSQEDVEAFELLASQASRALNVANEFEDLRRTQQELELSRAELEREKVFHESLVRAQSDLGEGVCIVNLETQRFEFVNDAYCEMHGYTRQELLDMPSFFDLIAEEDKERLEPGLAARLQGVRISDEHEVTGVRKDGTTLRVEAVSKPLDDVRLVVLVRDVTERWQWARAMERSLSLLEATLESTTDGILVVDSDGRMSAFNSRFVEMWGLPRDVVDSGDDDRALEAALGQLEDPDGFMVNVRELFGSAEESFDCVAFKDGRFFERYSKPQRLGGDDGEIVGRVWSFRDVTARRAAERALEETNAALVRADREKRRLLTHLVRAKEEERKRVASDIHDDSIQVMTSVVIGLERLARQTRDPERHEALARLEDAARGAVSRLRTMVFELRPPTLDEEGLGSALRLYLEEFQLDTGVGYTFHNTLSEEPPLSYRTVLYRIAQEALTNVRKHARASHVTVRLRHTDRGIGLSIEDNGIGWDLGSANGGTLRHIGIPEMRERAEISGGQLEVRSTPGRGTVVDVWIPEPDEARVDSHVV